MRTATLFYDGATFVFEPDVARDLVARGVIEPDPTGSHAYQLNIHHTVDEIEPVARVTERVTGDDARGESSWQGRIRLFATRFSHRDGQGGAR